MQRCSAVEAASINLLESGRFPLQNGRSGLIGWKMGGLEPLPLPASRARIGKKGKKAEPRHTAFRREMPRLPCDRTIAQSWPLDIASFPAWNALKGIMRPCLHAANTKELGGEHTDFASVQLRKIRNGGWKPATPAFAGRGI